MALVALGLAVTSPAAVAAQTSTTTTLGPAPSDTSVEGSVTSSTLPPCPDPGSVTYTAVFTGDPAGVDGESITFEDVELEAGDVSAPVVVDYPEGIPVIDGDTDRLRVRATEDPTGLRSEVACGGTTTDDNQPLEVDDDRLAAIGRTAGDFSQRLGRWALFASLSLFALVAVVTLFRRWRPRLW